jgi:hypothetical protein
MKNVSVVFIVGLCAAVFGCDNSEHSSHVHNEVVAPEEDPQVENTNDEILQDKPQEENGCDTNPDSVDSPPFGYDADWCYTADHAIQCEWYVGPAGPKGCYESYTFYHNECVWIFQYDYCS